MLTSMAPFFVVCKRAFHGIEAKRVARFWNGNHNALESGEARSFAEGEGKPEAGAATRENVDLVADEAKGKAIRRRDGLIFGAERGG